MKLAIHPGDPRDPAVTALLQASHALMQSLYPPEDNYYLSIDALCTPTIRFFVAEKNGKILGCAAIALKDGYGELKSMFVDPAARGSGVADALLHHLDQIARAENLPVLRLETGPGLDAAHKLYARHGFTPCDRFGDYPEAANSIFMEKRIA